MDKERLYQITIVLLLGIIIVMGLIMAIKLPRRAPVPPAKRIARPAKPPAVPKGMIAIVIDDIGYTTSNLSILDGLSAPITFSVLPNLRFSESAAEELVRRGFEVILHLPMEPLENAGLEQDTILTSMDEPRIRSIIAEDLAQLPMARGVSNHMGSRATEDTRTMEIVLKEIKKKNFYFLDSFVTARSVVPRVASQHNVKFIKRDVFLDNTLEAGFIRRQFALLKQKAQRSGSAVGIGHDRTVTLEVLKEIVPELQREGFKLVFASDLAR